MGQIAACKKRDLTSYMCSCTFNDPPHLKQGLIRKKRRRYAQHLEILICFADKRQRNGASMIRALCSLLRIDNRDLCFLTQLYNFIRKFEIILKIKIHLRCKEIA